MDIVIYEDTRDSIVGRELIDGENYGEFYLNGSGAVWYRCESLLPLFVNRDRSAFEQSVAVWRWYRAEVAQFSDEDGQLRVVGELRRKLGLDPLALAQPEAYWAVVVEQVQDGLL